MDKHNEQFTPEAVDEQVDELLQSQLATSSDVQMAHDLSQLYTEKPGSLESVWHRLGLDEHMSFSDAVRQRNTSQERMTSQIRMTRDERNHGMLLSSHNPIPQRSFGRRFAVLAAVLVAALLVGSVFLVLNRVTHSNQNVASPNTINQQQGLLSRTPSGVYIGGSDSVARLNRQTGKTLWKYSHPSTGLLAQKIIALGNTVYVSMVDYGNTSAGTTSAVLAIDAQMGHLRWSHTFKGSVNDLVTAGNMLYVGNYNEPATTIYAFDATSGAQHVTYQISGGVITLNVADNVLYVGSSSGLSALSLSDGKWLWYNSSVIPRSLVEAFIVNKVLYIATSVDSRKARFGVAAFNASTGKLLWQDDIQDELDALAVANGKVFVGTVVTGGTLPYKGNLRMYDARDGKLDWNTALDGFIQGPLTIDNNLIYVSLFHNSDLPADVAALALANGHIQWKTQIAAGWVTQAIVSNGVVYVSTSDSSTSHGNTNTSDTTTALNAVTGRPIWAVSSNVARIFTLMVAD